MRQFSIGATAAVVAAGGYATLYRLGQTWGATDQERQQALVGDELLPNARAWTTHAITIEAPAPQVWPWLVQMGLGTGRLVHRPLGRPAAVPGQRPQRRPDPPRAPAAAGGRPAP
jgi:hypothetical protein